MHTRQTQIQAARARGGYSGNREANALWYLSKGELMEIAMRLAVVAGADDTPEAATTRCLAELEILRANGIL